MSLSDLRLIDGFSLFLCLKNERAGAGTTDPLYQVLTWGRTHPFS